MTADSEEDRKAAPALGLTTRRATCQQRTNLVPLEDELKRSGGWPT